MILKQKVLAEVPIGLLLEITMPFNKRSSRTFHEKVDICNPHLPLYLFHYKIILFTDIKKVQNVNTMCL